MTSSPPVIYHSGRRVDHTDSVIFDAAYNIRLSEREKTLLLYLSRCGKGFRPALKDIENQTGIGRDAIHKVRAGLVRHGIIYYGRGRIVLYWGRLRMFASMPVRLSKHDAIHGTFFPPRRRKRKPTLRQLSRRYGDKDDAPPRPLTQSEQRFLSVIGRMTEKEYNQMLSLWRNDYDGNF